MSNNTMMDVYRELGLQSVINATGTVTRLGGAPMPQAVLNAFVAAADESVPIEALQSIASKRIAAATGAEAGLVTSGAAAALTLGTAAILARHDLQRMEQLPHCDGIPCELIISRDQRSGYDHAVRAAGARLVEVGFNEIVAGAGVRRTEVWEFEAALSNQTAGILYVYHPESQPPLPSVIQCAHDVGVPVLVDAAGELPPRGNLKRLIAMGADLVAFSGGKAIRGPQSTGILCGRRDLISSAALQMLDMDDHYALWDPPPNLICKDQVNGIPRHGIGRGMKVSKEQIVALLAALELFSSGAYEHERAAMRARLDLIAAEVRNCDSATASVIVQRDQQPLLIISLDNNRHDALQICRQLRDGTPPIYVGHSRLSKHELVVNPTCMRDEHAPVVGARLVELLSPRQSGKDA